VILAEKGWSTGYLVLCPAKSAQLHLQNNYPDAVDGEPESLAEYRIEWP